MVNIIYDEWKQRQDGIGGDAKGVGVHFGLRHVAGQGSPSRPPGWRWRAKLAGGCGAAGTPTRASSSGVAKTGGMADMPSLIGSHASSTGSGLEITRRIHGNYNVALRDNRPVWFRRIAAYCRDGSARQILLALDSNSCHNIIKLEQKFPVRNARKANWCNCFTALKAFQVTQDLPWC